MTLPGIQYTLIVSTLLSTIFTVNSYGTIYLLTSGGPLNATRVIGLLTFERGFSARDWGSGTAIAIILLPRLRRCDLVPGVLHASWYTG